MFCTFDVCVTDAEKPNLWRSKRSLTGRNSIPIRRAPGSCALSHRHILLYWGGGELTIVTCTTSWKFIVNVRLRCNYASYKTIGA